MWSKCKILTITQLRTFYHMEGDFPDGPGVKVLPSNAGAADSTPGQRATIPDASWPKTRNTEQKHVESSCKRKLKVVGLWGHILYKFV